MSVFQNVSGVDREVRVDGRPSMVVAGETVTVGDEFDYQLIGQSDTWKFTKKKSVVAGSVVSESVVAEQGVI